MEHPTFLIADDSRAKHNLSTSRICHAFGIDEEAPGDRILHTWTIPKSLEIVQTRTDIDVSVIDYNFGDAPLPERLTGPYLIRQWREIEKNRQQIQKTILILCSNTSYEDFLAMRQKAMDAGADMAISCEPLTERSNPELSWDGILPTLKELLASR